MTKIAGVGPDAPTVTLDNGAKHAYSPYRFDLTDAKAMFAMAKVLADGAEKYGTDNWRGIPVNEQINHALQHFYAYLAGDTSDDHLSHALCRAMFALAVHLDHEQDAAPASDHEQYEAPASLLPIGDFDYEALVGKSKQELADDYVPIRLSGAYRRP